jgi:hypothetical protein
MVDFRNHTTVPKNFDLEKTLVENHRVQTNNEVLIYIGISAIILVIGLAIYNTLEQRKNQIKYGIVQD